MKNGAMYRYGETVPSSRRSRTGSGSLGRTAGAARGAGAPPPWVVAVPSLEVTVVPRAQVATRLASRTACVQAASDDCLLCLGTVRNEPPQLPPPPGTAAMSHLPEVFGAWSLI